ncbi:ATP-binding protein [Amycolatopsis sp. PS_44_ISF1]|uniref:sensor histidine kinase n=1 Tax=Amycolatopsis sp. PS_44_ISF1 TaxID=2974917 RepID=UPI0028DDF70B|nr:ATP-binding protein [Amycolatopsis sp. PS_44_ISF1]MDT8910466.1 ATP-binding protein [Amycolatopsis sp. PS_44_ISF1]
MAAQASGDRSERSSSFLVTLLRRGTPALATATTGLTDEIADPTPVRALKRISRMTGPVDVRYNDGLMLRAARYVVLVPLAYRIVAVPGAFGAFVAAHGTRDALPVGLVALCSVLMSVFGLFWMLRRAPFRSDRAARLLIADLVITIGFQLVIGLSVPSAVFHDALGVADKHLLGDVALLTLAVGIPSGIGLGLISLPVRLLSDWLNRGSADFAQAWSLYPTMFGVLFTGIGGLILLGLGIRLALAYGIRNGRLAERAQQHRMLHDTVLQTLEAISLGGAGDARERLVEVQRLARAQAMELRQTIETAAAERAEEGSRPLGEKLAALAAEMARDGLRAQLVISELDNDTLTEVRQIAIRDAVREALRNTMKHAGTDKVVVRVEEREGGIAVITRDHGTGFSAESRPAGFGISESITARLAEVGGTSLVESTPGSGTRVTLWVPF